MPAPFRRLWALLAMALLAVTAVTPAVAHTDLVSSDPADGQTLSAPPQKLTMRFGEDILDGGARVVAEDDRGAEVALGPVQVAGPDLIATWPQTAAAGKYTVAWRAVSDDGHPLEGTFAFTVKSADESPTADTPTADPQSGRRRPSAGHRREPRGAWAVRDRARRSGAHRLAVACRLTLAAGPAPAARRGGSCLP